MKSRFAALIMLAGLMLGSGVLPVGGCIGENLWRFNPCGTILSPNICTPDQWYQLIFDKPDWDIDPACPIPFQCP